MRFVLRMAVRETRASWRRLLFFFVCIAVGVAAIVALRSVIQSVRDVFGARGAVADRRRRADLDQPRLDARGARDDRSPAARTPARPDRTETIETPTMVRPADRAEGGRADGRAAGRRSREFPLYGTLDAATAGSLLARAAARTTARWSGRSC